MRVVTPTPFGFFDDAHLSFGNGLAKKIICADADFRRFLFGQIKCLVGFCTDTEIRQIVARNFEY
ncbi:MAG: hypothetical protein M3Q78_07710, partial [Acidobacteriota bacterium]|nr:hypothetical protein [Acidobacteriota bacterium]